MTESDFLKRAEATFSRITDILTELEESDGDIEVDIKSDSVLYVNALRGTFVISRNIAAKQIWLSSPISGPSHFSWRDGSWKNKDGMDLVSLISKEIS